MREVPEEYEVVSRRELAGRLGIEPATLGTYLWRESWHLVPEPDGRLERSPYWYEGTVREWERSRRIGGIRDDSDADRHAEAGAPTAKDGGANA